MKLNNKGFAISGVLYSLLILFITLFVGILTILATTKFSLDKVKKDITSKLENLTYRDTILNGADPVLKEGMIPVTIDADGTVRKADMTQAWYDYDNKKWANAVTVSQSERSRYETVSSGTIISEDAILTYFVWIPRYKYKLWHAYESNGGSGYVDETEVHSINIVFEGKNSVKSTGSKNGQYLSHPAFTFGDEELNGFWVGKFETGYNGARTTAEAEVEGPDSTAVIIKPNTYSWRKIDLGDIFNTVTSMNMDYVQYGLNEDSNTHVMKNVEWGAVAYLSHSAYGTCNDGVCTAVHVNNSSDFITGCGYETYDNINYEYGKSVGTCYNQYGTNNNGIYNQSTNGNITGIFDMSGGSHEYVMGYTKSTEDLEYDKSGLMASYIDYNKYIDLYDSEFSYDYATRILGDATGEMGPINAETPTNAGSDATSWYGDHAQMAISTSPWFMRGGFFDSLGGSEGIFYLNNATGQAYAHVSFRVVLS